MTASSASDCRPRKPLRAAPRCSIVAFPLVREHDVGRGPEAEIGPVRALVRPRSDGTVAPVLVPVPGGSVRRDGAPADFREDAADGVAGSRSRRRLGEAASLGGVALVSALGGFLLGNAFVLPTGDASAPPSGSRTPLPAAGGASAAPPSISTARPGGSRTSPFEAPFPALSARPAVRPPWSDVEAMERGLSPVDTATFDALVRDNRRLDAEVVALEAEATSLQRELLDLELRLFAAGAPLVADQPRSDVAPAAAVAGEPLANVVADLDTAVQAYDDETRTFGDDALQTFDDETFSATVLSELEEAAEAVDDPAFTSALELYASELAAAEAIDLSAGTDDLPIASAALGAPQQRLVVADVPPGSAAESVGLLPGDILFAIDGSEIGGIEDVFASNDGSATGRMHELSIVRDGARFPLLYTGVPADLTLRLDWVDPVFTDR